MDKENVIMDKMKQKMPIIKGIYVKLSIKFPEVDHDDSPMGFEILTAICSPL